jgi:general secretion pathway protein L
MAQKILGLDIGAHSVKGLVLEGTLRGYTVVRQLSVPRPPAPPAPPPVEGQPAPEPPDTLVPAVQSLMAQLVDVQVDGVAVSLPGAQAATPLLALPFVDPRKIESTLPFEVEGVIPLDIDEVFYDHQVLAQKDGRSELLVGVARKEDVLALMARLSEAGVDPRVITLPGLAYRLVLAELGAREPGGVALVDIGHERTTVVVSEGAGDASVLRYSRTFSGGGADLTAALVREFQVSAAEAEAWKERDGDVSEDAADPRASNTLRKALGPLVREIRQSLRAGQTRGRDPVARIHLAGGTARLRGLSSMLTRELGTPVEKISLPSDAAAGITPDDQPLMAQSLGLALRAQARGGKLLNFRKGELAFRGDTDYLRGKVSRLVAFAAVLLVLFAATIWARIQTLKAAEARMDDALCEVTTRTLGTCEKDFNLAVSKLQGGDTKAANIPTASAMEVFNEAVTHLPQAVGAKLTDVDVSLEQARLKGVVDSFDGVDQIVAELKRSTCFGDVKRGKVQKTKDEKVEFTLDVSWVCGQNADKAGT